MSVPWLWIGIFVSAFVLMVAMAPYQALLPKFVQGQFHRGVGSYGCCSRSSRSEWQPARSFSAA